MLSSSRHSWLKNLLFVCGFVFALGQFATLGKSQTYGFYLYDVVLAVFFVMGLANILKNKQMVLPANGVYFSIFSLIAFFSISRYVLRIPEVELLVAFGYLCRWLIYFGSAFVTFNLLKFGALNKSDVLKAILLSTTFVCISGFIQLLIFPDLGNLDAALGWDPHKNRLVSLFLDPNFTAAYIVLGLSCLILCWETFNKRLAGFLLLIHILALILTFSRSGWLMFAVFIFVYGCSKNLKLVFISCFVALIAYAVVPRIQSRLMGITDPNDSAHFRLISWKNTYQIAQNNWLLGVGFNRFRFVQKEYAIFSAGSLGGHSGSGSDSSILTVFATTGVFGVVFFCFGMLSGVSKSLFLRSIVLPLFIESQFVNSLFYPQILWVFLMICFSYSFFDK